VRLFSANDVDPQRMVAIGYADNRPVVPNTDSASRARNRRVTMLIISEAPNKTTEIPIKGAQQEAPPAPKVP
jgi:chemotaxis protein MotB